MAEVQCAPHSRPALIAPSLLASDLANLASESQRVLDAGADYLHLDIMDGHFVPNLTWGPPVVKSLRKRLPEAFLDCHLMVTEPETWLEPLAEAGATQFTFHLEAIRDGLPGDADTEAVHAAVRALNEKVKAKGMKAGITIKPGTPVETILPLAPLFDIILIMTVEPGFGGQSFMPEMMHKVAALRAAHPDLNIEVDGGLGLSTIDAAAKAGANVIVAGSAIFKGDQEPREAITTMKQSIERHGHGRKQE